MRTGNDGENCECRLGCTSLRGLFGSYIEEGHGGRVERTPKLSMQLLRGEGGDKP